MSRWQHLCASWDGTAGVAGIALYQNGTSVAQNDSGSNGNGNDSDAGRDLRLGGVNDGTLPFDGMIDDFRLYERVLSPPEIAALHACVNP